MSETLRKTAPIVPLAAFLILAGAGCSGTKPAEPGAPAPIPAPQQDKASFGQPVTLTVGQSARYADGLQVRLEKIDDSRCPAGVVCVWEGELAPLLRLVGGSVATEQELRLGTVRAVEATLGSYAIALREATTTTATIVVSNANPTAAVADDELRLTSPTKDQLVASPLTVRGAARGSWYFEASFPVRLLDAQGKLLVERPAQAQGEWMTTKFVPFEVVLEFAGPTTATGTLVLEKDNPSGLPQHDDSRTIPVRFATDGRVPSS